MRQVSKGRKEDCLLQKNSSEQGGRQNIAVRTPEQWLREARALANAQMRAFVAPEWHRGGCAGRPVSQESPKEKPCHGNLRLSNLRLPLTERREPQPEVRKGLQVKSEAPVQASWKDACAAPAACHCHSVLRRHGGRSLCVCPP